MTKYLIKFFTDNFMTVCASPVDYIVMRSLNFSSIAN